MISKATLSALSAFTLKSMTLNDLHMFFIMLKFVLYRFDWIILCGFRRQLCTNE